MNLHYHELMGKTKKNQEKKYLMVGDHILDKILDSIKEILKSLMIEKY